jgi:hypothetical protein
MMSIPAVNGASIQNETGRPKAAGPCRSGSPGQVRVVPVVEAPEPTPEVPPDELTPEPDMEEFASEPEEPDPDPPSEEPLVEDP